MEVVQPIRSVEKLERMKTVLKGYSDRDWFLLVMGINVGLRIGDLLKLHVRDVRNKSHLRIIEGKTQKRKKFPINSELREIINNYTKGMRDSDPLFKSYRTKQNIGRVQAYRILNKAAAEVGLVEIGTHTLRKTFGYHFYKRYKDVALLQEIFNHSAPSITLRYIGINQDIIDEAIGGFHL
ncbi:site-specific integrase [Paenibacillus sp. HWE-109]|uniref:site-specific integrase n=1 Tax=Paenibacillus sp. HWE-109 TaxID=1306526 RepID=UPI001EDFD5D5|nr:site-specific integrase [Paenibacillus sp. HWE-109]UKS31122.1 site-specific integrase [Paenibacillus sp. HWE-109]